MEKKRKLRTHTIQINQKLLSFHLNIKKENIRCACQTGSFAGGDLKSANDPLYYCYTKILK